MVASSAYALWIVHGVMIESVPIIVFNALALLLGLAILVLKLRRSHHPPSRVKIGMFATSLPTIIGLIAGCLSSWSLVPQTLETLARGPG